MVMKYRTAEAVTPGHPDKLCDLISDMVLDDMLARDPHAHVAAETCAAGDTVMVFGEINSHDGYKPDVESVVRHAFRTVGYTDPSYGTTADGVRVVDGMHAQSAEIDAAVGDADGAGDQGVMVGYATDATETMLPPETELARQLAARLWEARANGIGWLRPDGKTQVTLRTDGGATALDSILISTQHDPGMTPAAIRGCVSMYIVDPVLAAHPELDATDWRLDVNPSGSFVLGGPEGDAGLTGRKIVVDQYGPSIPVGGGAFSGKDPSKVDRSAAYMARHIAVSLVHARLCYEATVRLAYGIGVAEPTDVSVDAHGTGIADDAILSAAVRDVFDLTPRGIIDALDLRRPRYADTALHGHFGRPELPWERPSDPGALRSAVEARL